MKKIAVLGVILFIFGYITFAVAESNISGLWGDGDRNPSLTNYQVIYSQIGNKINSAGHCEWNGTPVVWHGSGFIDGNKVEISFTYSKSPGWNDGDSGKHVFTLSPDGKTLSGKWINNRGQSGIAKHVLLKP
jgi:hypothetical protein